MKALNQYPMARILFPFMGGILLAPILPTLIGMWLLILLGLLLAFVLWLFTFKKYHHYKLRWINGFLISMLFLTLGIIGFWYSSPLNKQDHYSKFEESKAYLIKIESPFITKPEKYALQNHIGVQNKVYFVFVGHVRIGVEPYGCHLRVGANAVSWYINIALPRKFNYI